MQVTVTALIRNKPEPFVEFLKECGTRATDVLGTAFRPYDVSQQVHATLVGLERVVDPDGGYLNRNISRHREVEAEMDFGGLIKHFRNCVLFPIRIRIGGFADQDYSFTSRNRRPFDRSFTIQPTRAEDGTTAENLVVIGWPVRDVGPARPSDEAGEADWEYPGTLDELRRGADQFNVLHAYHEVETDVDNDFFFRLGRIDDTDCVPLDAKQELLESMRLWLSRHNPVIVEVGLSDVYVTQYKSAELPPEDGETVAYAIDDPAVDDQFCRALFETTL